MSEPTISDENLRRGMENLQAYEKRREQLEGFYAFVYDEMLKHLERRRKERDKETWRTWEA